MRDFSKNRYRRSYELLRLIAGILGVLVLTFLVVVSTRAAWGMYQKFTQAGQGRQAAEEELASLKEKEERISTAVVALSSERGIEAEVRARFGVVKPGEGEIKIVRDKDEEKTLSGEPQSIWARIWEALFVW